MMRAVILNVIAIGYSSSTDAIAFYADFQYLKTCAFSNLQTS